MKRLTTLSALAAMAALTANSAAANALLNGGFESGAGADADNWNQLEINGGPLRWRLPTEAR